jgi:hypothetical protein
MTFLGEAIPKWFVHASKLQLILVFLKRVDARLLAGLVGDNKSSTQVVKECTLLPNKLESFS